MTINPTEYAKLHAATSKQPVFGSETASCVSSPGIAADFAPFGFAREGAKALPTAYGKDYLQGYLARAH